MHDEWYLDAEEVEQPIISAGGIILGSTNTRNGVLCGAIQDLDAIPSGPWSKRGASRNPG